MTNYTFDFKNLTFNSKKEIIDVFNQCFSDYPIPYQLTMAAFDKKVKSENIHLDRSLGAYYNNQLIAFVLIAICGNTAYNAGTGVLPLWRGFNLTVQIYRHMLPDLALDGIKSHSLEVLLRNSVALNVYKKIGFRISRKLTCYKGIIKIDNAIYGHTIESVECLPLVDENEFMDSQPTFQNSLLTINRKQDNLVFNVIKCGNEVMAWMIYDQEQWRIKSFAVKKEHRKKGYGSSLFSMLKSKAQNQVVSVINIDFTDAHTKSFLEKIGLKPYITQYEMCYQYGN